MNAKSRRETIAMRRYTAKVHTITRHSVQVRQHKALEEAHAAAAIGDDQQGAVLHSLSMLYREGVLE